VLTKKTDPDGNAREDGVCNKFRISISEGGRGEIKVPTHSSCADDITNRLIAVLAPVLQAEHVHRRRRRVLPRDTTDNG